MTSNPVPGSLVAGRARSRWAKAALFLAPLVTIAVGWQLLTEVGLLNTRMTPPPTEIGARLAVLATGEGHFLLWQNLWASASRVIPALVIAGVLGVLLGVAVGLSRTVYEYLAPIISLLLPLPAVAWTPVFVVSIGRGYPTMLLVLVLGAIFPVLFNVMSGVQGIGQQRIWVLESMGAGRLRVLLQVILPATWPSILTGLRVGMGHAWRTLVAVEMLTAATAGVGALIFNSRSSLDTVTMYGSVMILALGGFLIENAVFRPWEKRTLGRWGVEG